MPQCRIGAWFVLKPRDRWPIEAQEVSDLA
jgi:hypothetical protein